MFYITRQFVCDRLRVSVWASYGIAPATDIGHIPSDRIIRTLNNSRRAGEPEIDFIPSDLLTAEELSAETGIPSRKLLMWTRRKVKAIPHYRINKQTTRFRRSSALMWLERRTRG